MEPLSAVIATQLSKWEIDDLPLERELFGFATPEGIAAAVDAWCRVHLDAAIRCYEFFHASSGSVHGLRLEDGRSVVVKGHRPSIDVEYLNAAAAVQRALANVGFPAPHPIVSATPAGHGHLTAEEMLGARVDADGHDPSVRRLLAGALQDVHELATAQRSALEGVTFPMSVADGALYPPPHSPRFDFATTVAGAEWIDEFARTSRRVLRSSNAGQLVVTHGDWRIENVAVATGALTAVYDWDSVHLEREPVTVAVAATTFSVDWRHPEGTRFPSPDEIAAFVTEYESARGSRFSEDERVLLGAAMVASLSYGARCEHADAGHPPSGEDSHRGLLRRLGRTLLDDGLDGLTS